MKYQLIPAVFLTLFGVFSSVAFADSARSISSLDTNRGNSRGVIAGARGSGNPFGTPGREPTKEESQAEFDRQYREAQRRTDYERANPPPVSRTPSRAVK